MANKAKRHQVLREKKPKRTMKRLRVLESSRTRGLDIPVSWAPKHAVR